MSVETFVFSFLSPSFTCTTILAPHDVLLIQLNSRLFTPLQLVRFLLDSKTKGIVDWFRLLETLELDHRIIDLFLEFEFPEFLIVQNFFETAHPGVVLSFIRGFLVLQIEFRKFGFLDDPGCAEFLENLREKFTP